MTIILNGTTGITNDGGYTGDGVVFADTTPADTLVTTTGGNVGIGTASPTVPLEIQTASGSSYTANIVARSSDNASTINFWNNAKATRNAFLYSDNSSFQVGVNGSERMRIDSSGNLLVGTTTATGRSGVNFRIGASATLGNDTQYLLNGSNSYFNIVSHVNTTSGTRFHIGFGDGTTWAERGTISTNGSSTTYSTASDYRLKENIAPLTNALAKVSTLKPCTYTWKESGVASQGFIAHELQEVVPEAVVGEKDAVNEDGSIKAQSIDTSFLVATLTAAIQEQQAIITDLKARLEVLEAK